jgi:hypothetical protein
MRVLTEQELSDNQDKIVEIINSTFTGTRLEKLKKMIEHFEDRMATAPASGKEHFHSAYPGGYNAHVLNVYDICMKNFELYKTVGMTIDYTPEEITMCALFHDLGKIGDVINEYYIPQDSNWHKENRGEIYKFNPNLVNMPVQDRSLYVLQHFGIQLTNNEWITIKIHDGMYDDGNKLYYVVWDDSRQLKTNLPFLVHQSDMMASRLEYEQWKNKVWEKTDKSTEFIQSEPQKSKKYAAKPTLADVIAKKPTDSDTNENLGSMFDELFKK